MNSSALSSPSADISTSVTDALENSWKFCRRVTRERAGNFYHGLKLMPEPKRSAMCAIYAWMRQVDDLADANSSTAAPALAMARQELESFARRTTLAIEGVTAEMSGSEAGNDLLWPAFSHTVQTYRISPEPFREMIAGQLLDQTRTRYADFDELRDYCYKVASTVGLICVRIWGTDGDQVVEDLAIKRGIALQLTNILRDVVEDARRGRVYLPVDELARFEFTPESFQSFVLNRANLKSEISNLKFIELMRFQIDRAARFYDESAALEGHISADCRPTSWAMMRIYRELLGKIAADPARVLQGRLSLSLPRKLLIALQAAWGRVG